MTTKRQNRGKVEKTPQSNNRQSEKARTARQNHYKHLTNKENGKASTKGKQPRSHKLTTETENNNRDKTTTTVCQRTIKRQTNYEKQNYFKEFQRKQVQK